LEATFAEMRTGFYGHNGNRIKMEEKDQPDTRCLFGYLPQHEWRRTKHRGKEEEKEGKRRAEGGLVLINI
jgi:hypothetical protein